MKRLTLALAILLAPALAAAQASQPKTVSNPGLGTVMPATDLSTSPTTGNLAMPVDGYSLAMLKVRLVRGGLAIDIGVSCEESDDGATNWSEVTQIQSGAITQFSPVYTTSVSTNFTIRLDVTGFIYVRCTFTGTNSNSSDTVALVVRRVRGI